MRESEHTFDQIDWPGLMRLGLGALRLTPDTFWAMSPAELRLALEGAGFLTSGTKLAMDRHNLDRLMRAFPDKADRGFKED